MKILSSFSDTPIQNRKSSYQQKPINNFRSSLKNDTFEKSNTISFKGPTKLTNPDLLPIKSFEEYKQVLERIYNTKNAKGNPIFDIARNLKEFPKVSKEEEGLLLYAGLDDLSGDINRYLTHRELIRTDEPTIKDVIRAFDYSLGKLDKKEGKYSGIVFRQGFFQTNEGQYISTTTDPEIAAYLRGGISFNKNLDFYVIDTKNAHKINTFQKRMGSFYADEEKEILIDRTANLREITSPTGNLLFAKRKLSNILEQCLRRPPERNQVRTFVQE